MAMVPWFDHMVKMLEAITRGCYRNACVRVYVRVCQYIGTDNSSCLRQVRAGDATAHRVKSDSSLVFRMGTY